MAEPITYVTSFLVKIITFILGPFFRKPIDIVSKFLYLNAYEISTFYSLYFDVKRMFPHSLGGVIDYNINWSEIYLKKKQANCTLRIRARDNLSYSKITFCVTASLESLKYQSVVEVYDVSTTPCIIALPSIPLRSIEIKGNRIYEPYSSVSVEIKEIFDSNNNIIDIRGKWKDILHPIDNLDNIIKEKESDVYRWGQWWNLDFLESEKKEISRFFQAYSVNAKFWGLKTKYFWQPVAWFMSVPFILNIYFWIRNIIWANQLNKALEKHLNDYDYES